MELGHTHTHARTHIHAYTQTPTHTPKLPSQVIAKRSGWAIDFSTRHDNGELQPLGQADQQLGWQEYEADRRTNREFSFPSGWNYVSLFLCNLTTWINAGKCWDISFLYVQFCVLNAKKKTTWLGLGKDRAMALKASLDTNTAGEVLMSCQNVIVATNTAGICPKSFLTVCSGLTLRNVETLSGTTITGLINFSPVKPWHTKLTQRNASKANCCVTSRLLCLKKTAPKHIAKTTASGQ